ncbi:MAG: DUF1015 family protein, partial [Oscillospiraceae bacterium]|nr:DUF1015 family protein [Oscillospiraceae bacterium]
MTSSVNDPIFRPADILIPRVADMTAWSVVACDQFTSDREYWARAEARAGESPSALRLILPEIYLGEPDVARRIADLGGAAREYLRRGIFYEARDSFVLVRRTLASGKTRLGLIGALDLDAYEYERDGAPIRASEQTVPGRLPPRVKIRTASPLETPHLMALISDPERSVIEPLTARDLPRLYDFELMEGGGRVAGYRVSGEHADAAL